jgi:hypothetical protein
MVRFIFAFRNMNDKKSVKNFKAYSYARLAVVGKVLNP